MAATLAVVAASVTFDLAGHAADNISRTRIASQARLALEAMPP